MASDGIRYDKNGWIGHRGALLIGLALSAALAGCGSGPSALATTAHQEARVAERLVETHPGTAARRFADAGDAIDALARRHPGHPLSEELQHGDRVGNLPRAHFEMRLATARRVMGRADLLDAAVSLLPPPRKGLSRLSRRGGPRVADELRAALLAAKRPIPPAVEAHGPSPAPAPASSSPLPAPLPADAAALEAQWRNIRAHRDADVWLAAALPRLASSQRFVWARALHRGRGWQALAALLIEAGDREGASMALGFAVERGLLEGLAAPLRPEGWLPVLIDRTLTAAGESARAERWRALYAAGLARTAAIPDHTLTDLQAKADALAARAVEAGDPVAAGWLGQVLRRDVLDGVRRRARRPGRDPAVLAAYARIQTLDAAERAEPALAAVRALAPALAAAAAAHGAQVAVPDSAEGLSAPDRVVYHLARARLGDGDRHIGAALDAAAGLGTVEARIRALIDARAVQAHLGLDPGPGLRAGLARLLFTARDDR